MNVDSLLELRIETGFHWFEELDIINAMLIEKSISFLQITSFNKHF